jgi:heterodisulfide reductase subunit C
MKAENTAASEIRTFVERMSGQLLRECYQCGKCAAGCPLGRVVDLSPQQILRALQLGQPELALDSKALWLCVGCQTCVTRCPCEVDLPRVMDALRAWATMEGRGAALREAPIFHRVFLKSIELTGRAYEAGLTGAYNLLSRHFFATTDLALPMILRGKIKPFPRRIRARAEVAGIFERAAALRERERAAAVQRGGAR